MAPAPERSVLPARASAHGVLLFSPPTPGAAFMHQRQLLGALGGGGSPGARQLLPLFRVFLSAKNLTPPPPILQSSCSSWWRTWKSSLHSRSGVPFSPGAPISLPQQ